jgi:hypothetical protein
MAVDVRQGVTGAEIGTPAVLVPANELKAVVQGLDYDDYAVTNDGQRFLIKTPVADRVMLNWPSLPAEIGFSQEQFVLFGRDDLL